MTTARELWEQNRNDETTRRLNEKLSMTSPSRDSPSPVEAAEALAQKQGGSDVLFGMSPKGVQNLNGDLAGEKK